MEAICSSATSVETQRAARRHIPDVTPWVSTDVSEEHIASIFRVEEKVQQKPAGGIILWDITLLSSALLSWNHWQNKVRNGHNRWRRTHVALVSPSEMGRQCVCAWRPVRIDSKHAYLAPLHPPACNFRQDVHASCAHETCTGLNAPLVSFVM
jgi:hypothetical protein